MKKSEGSFPTTAVIVVLIALISSTIFPATNVAAVQAQWSSVNLFWRRTSESMTGATSIRQQLQVNQLGAHSYVALVWTFSAGEGGYMGIQSNPTTSDRSTPPPFGTNFAIWDSTQASGMHCGAFEGEGIGRRCTTPLTFLPGATYIFHLVRQSYDPSTGNWLWQSSIDVITDSGTDKITIGNIGTPSSTVSSNGLINFEEYFGQMPSTCEAIPITSVSFWPPVAKDGNADITFAFDQSSMLRGPNACSATGGANSGGAKIGDFVDLMLGGPRNSLFGYQIHSEDGRCLVDAATGDNRSPYMDSCTEKQRSAKWYLGLPIADTTGGSLVGTIESESGCLTWGLIPPVSVTIEKCSEVTFAQQNWARPEDGTLRPLSFSNTMCLSNGSNVAVIRLKVCDGTKAQQWFQTLPNENMSFTALSPQRLFDTRKSSPNGLRVVEKNKVGLGYILRVKATGIAGIPALGVGAVSLNVTATEPTDNGYVTVYPCGPIELSSNLNFVANQTIPNAVIAPIDPATGDICFYANTPTDLIADINGWFLG